MKERTQAPWEPGWAGRAGPAVGVFSRPGEVSQRAAPQMLTPIVSYCPQGAPRWAQAGHTTSHFNLIFLPSG